MTLNEPSNLRPYVVTLGTAGGPRWWKSYDGAHLSGIATAVVVGDATYLIDAGHGVGSQLAKAGLGIPSLRGIFLTHLHSDHTIDLSSLLVFGFLHLPDPDQPPIKIIGPGNRGMAPLASARANVPPQPVSPENPTPGTAEMVDLLFRAYATDINDRVMDSLRPSPLNLFLAEDIELPPGSGFDANRNPTPDIEPFEIYRDELVTVTATLVVHPPIAPAFAFRFQTAAGSVTISGDTAPSQNLVRLAENTDLLLHEAIDFDRMEANYAHESKETAHATMDHHRKSHTSASQAGEIATQARAKNLALHHLSPGNADPEVWMSAEQTFSGPVRVPRDLEVITFGNTRPDLSST